MNDPDHALVDAVARLWAVQRPYPDSLFQHPAFLQLDHVCRTLFPSAYGGGFHQSVLMNSLRSLGLPCLLPETASIAISTDQASSRLSDAFRQTTIRRLHFCPLDCADDLLSLAFGPAVVRRFARSELHEAMNADRLLRFHPTQALDTARLAEFQWLVVEERIELASAPGVRELPGWSFDPNEDFAAINPHQRQFPSIVEDALFFLLLAPWEEWAEMTGFQWRGFHVPWIFTTDDDLFGRPPHPPSPDTLSWEPRFHTDSEGREIEFERPSQYPLGISVATDLPIWNQDLWERVQAARSNSLFDTPVAHFFRPCLP